MIEMGLNQDHLVLYMRFKAYVLDSQVRNPGFEGLDLSRA